MKLVAHIGTPKTGTTSIQAFLDSNRDKLIESGYYYLRSMGNRTHEAFPRCCFSDDHINDDYFWKRRIYTREELIAHRNLKLEDLENELSSIPDGVHTVVTSCEHFYSRLKSVEEIENFRKISDKYFSDIRIIVYLREQSDVAVSLYSTNLKASGGTKSLTEFVQANCRADNDYFNYFNTLEKWASVFGREKISVRLFDRNEFVNGNLLEDVVAHALPDATNRLNVEFDSLNESLDHIGQVLARCVNSNFPKFVQGVGLNQFNQSLINVVAERFKGKGETLSEEESERIVMEFSESNEKLLQKYFAGRAVLFNRKPKSNTNQNKILSAEQEDGLSMIINRVAGRAPSLGVREINAIRDAALSLEKYDIQKAFELMRIAAEFRPNGTLIRKKMGQYKNKLGIVDE